MVEIRDVRREDYPDILRLNAEWVHFLAPLDEAGLKALLKMTDLACVAVEGDAVIGFLVALRDGASYDSPNYTYFEDRYERFIYIDRIVIDAEAHGKGVGRALYDAVFKRAEDTRVPLVTCEIDVDPPNPGSLSFHKQIGFVEVDELVITDAAKTVSLQVRQIA